MKHLFSLMALPLLLLAAATPLRAQWTSQEIPLNPGWNAIHLEVQPEPAAADAVFAGLPIASAWEWRRDRPTAQFVSDVTRLTPRTPDWATWLPPNHANRILSDLVVVKGGRPLLINLSGTTPQVLRVVGHPVRPQNNWLANTYNLAGMAVDGTGAPTFRAFFANSIGHIGTDSRNPFVFTLNPTGTWVFLPNTNPIQRGRAYWVQTVGPADYEGPLAVTPPTSSGVNFGVEGTESELRFTNLNASGNRTVTIQPLPSLPRPAAAIDSPVVAGPVALSYRDLSVITSEAPLAPWVPFSGPLTFVVAPGEEKLIQLAVRRRDLAAPAAGSGPDHTYQSLIEVKEGGTRQLIGVTVVQETAGGTGARTARNGSGAVPDRSGLWVGSVTVDAVSWAGDKSPNIVLANPAFNGADRTTPRPTPTEFQFKLIVHVDGSGTARLLQKVIQVWQNGTYVPDPKNPGTQTPGTPGAFRLFTDDLAATRAGFTGTALRDGEFIGRRISTANFAIRQPVVMSGAGAFGGGPVSASVATSYNDPLNPYRHSYHPQHDNLDPRYASTLPAGIESWNLNRVLTLQFEAAHPFGRQDLPAWGSSVLGGTYLETITGPHRHPIYVRGKFLLTRVSNVTRLN